MPVVKNEQDEKRDSQFLKYNAGDSGNTLMLKSHLYKIDYHFVPSPIQRGVRCKGEGCSYCAKGFQKRTEYNYMVFLNGEVGFIDIKPSVFFAIQGIAKAQKKDVRQMSWTVIKMGSGLDTEYTTSKDDNLDKEDFDRVMSEIDSNTEKLTQVMLKHEEQLDKNYSLFENKAKLQSKKDDELAESSTDLPL